MSTRNGPEHDPALASHLRTASQQAVQATATAYTNDASIDVEARLAAELADRGLEIDDEGWLAEVARRVRSGYPVDFDDPYRPGSLGGDNGGG